MKPLNEKLCADLLEAGKKEFLEKGFLGASMRSIAASLGVTTGAIYRYYTDKEALFDTLVEGPAKEMEKKYRGVQQEFARLPVTEQLAGLPKISEEGQDWMFRAIYDNFDAFKLIACCSVGTKYEHYIDGLVEIEANASRVLLERMEEDGMPICSLDDELIHMVSNMLFSGMFETVRHDMSREKAERYFTTLREFYAAGWFKILGI